MLGKNIIQLQEELSYMPMQRLIDMVDDPNSIYGSLTLVEIKNREALQNSSTNMSPTSTVAVLAAAVALCLLLITPQTSQSKLVGE